MRRRASGIVTGTQVELLDAALRSTPVRELYRYEPSWGVPSEEDLKELREAMLEPPPSATAEGRRP